MRGFLLLGLCLALTACPSASGDNGPPRGVTASVLQVGDSVRIILQWTITPPGSRQLPLLRFDTRLRQGASTILASGTAPATGRADTLTIPAPPVGDTLADLRGEVRAVDTRLVSSGYVASPPFRVVITPLPPNPPDSVRADTLTVLGATGPAFGAQANIGEPLRVFGTGFADGQAVRIGGVPVAIASRSGDSVWLVTVPAGVPLFTRPDVQVGDAVLPAAFLVSDEPWYQGAPGNVMIYREDFERYADLAAFKAAYPARRERGGTIVLDTAASANAPYVDSILRAQGCVQTRDIACPPAPVLAPLRFGMVRRP